MPYPSFSVCTLIKFQTSPFNKSADSSILVTLSCLLYYYSYFKLFSAKVLSNLNISFLWFFLCMTPNGRKLYAVADCGLLSCRATPPLLRTKQLVVSTKRQLTYSFCYGQVFYQLSFYNNVYFFFYSPVFEPISV
jgi:hypothetical protein